MSTKTLSLAGTLAATAITAVGAGHALADTTVAADATAQNVTAYGSTAAWSQKAADGYRLVIRQAGTIVPAPVPVSSRPYDPDLGPTKANGRTIVYARGGDLYRYDVGAAAEQKLTSLSSAATETAPSFFKDTIVFSRTDGKSPGTYLLRPGKKLVRIYKTVALETDVAATRIVGRYGKANKSIIRILNMNADNVRIVARAKAGQRVTSPSLTRFNGIWLRVKVGSAAVEQVGVNSHRGLNVLTGDRDLPDGTSSVASTNIPTLYTGFAGVQAIGPKLRMG